MAEPKWAEIFAYLDHEASSHNGARKHDKAPPGPLTRELNQHQQRTKDAHTTHGKKAGNKKEK